jgi:hypothetical protein
MGSTGEMMGEEILAPYRTWSAAASDLMLAGHAFLGEMQRNGYEAEDLGDWIDSVTTLLSFTPHVPDAPQPQEA